MSTWIAIAVPVGVAVAVAVPVIGTYNRLVASKQAYLTAFAGIEVELKRRLDLIPNLVETAKAYLGHESETLLAVTEARNGASRALNEGAAAPATPAAMEGLRGAEALLTRALGQFRVTVEAYPELKASETMQQLSSQLTETEDRVANARQAFNGQVERYNTLRQSFPAVVIAPMLGHRDDAVLLQFEDSEALQAAPSVDFGRS